MAKDPKFRRFAISPLDRLMIAYGALVGTGMVWYATGSLAAGLLLGLIPGMVGVCVIHLLMKLLPPPTSPLASLEVLRTLPSHLYWVRLGLATLVGATMIAYSYYAGGPASTMAIAAVLGGMLLLCCHFRLRGPLRAAPTSSKQILP